MFTTSTGEQQDAEHPPELALHQSPGPPQRTPDPHPGGDVQPDVRRALAFHQDDGPGQHQADTEDQHAARRRPGSSATAMHRPRRTRSPRRCRHRSRSTASPQPPTSSMNDSDCTSPTAASAGSDRPDQPQQLLRTDPMAELTPDRGQCDDPGQHARHHQNRTSWTPYVRSSAAPACWNGSSAPKNPPIPPGTVSSVRAAWTAASAMPASTGRPEHDRLVVGDGPGRVVQQVGRQPGPQRLAAASSARGCPRPYLPSSRPAAGLSPATQCTMITARAVQTATVSPERSGVCTTPGMGHYP